MKIKQTETEDGGVACTATTSETCKHKNGWYGTIHFFDIQEDDLCLFRLRVYAIRGKTC